jgi:hypothetical protein
MSEPLMFSVTWFESTPGGGDQGQGGGHFNHKTVVIILKKWKVSVLWLLHSILKNREVKYN